MSTTVVTFEAHRDHLIGVAYRMLGSRADAEDAVQEAWLRWDAADQAEIREPQAWLTTVTARICLDQLRSARVRREAYVGPWLPEPLVERLPASTLDPAEQAVRTDEVSYALLVVLERLNPEQRVALVLHDVFGVPFDEIATVLSVNPATARQLASRARRAVTATGAPRHSADLAEQHRVVSAFLAAVQSGDLQGLIAVLAPDAVALGDGGGVVPTGLRPITGPERVARFLMGLFEKYWHRAVRHSAEPILVNGDLGFSMSVTLPDGTLVHGVMAFAVSDGAITGVFNQLNPEKLAGVPQPDPDAGWTLPPLPATTQLREN